MPILESEQKERTYPPRIFGNSTHPFSQRLFRFLLQSSLYAALALFTLLVHGYHPFAEDGGLYAAGVEYLLDPKLFPHYTAFVTEHLQFSLFAPILTAIIRGTPLSLEWILLLLYLGCAALVFAAVDHLLRRLSFPFYSRLGGLLLLFTWWTLPVAGTSLFIEDPYLTARSFSTPLSLWAISFALDSRFAARRRWRQWIWSASCFLGAFAFHPLMTGYAFALLLCFLAVRSEHHVRFSCACALGALLLAGLIQWRATPESPAMIAAAMSRYYWFLSRWQWYELLGLAGPLLLLFALDRSGGGHLPQAGRVLIRACLLLGGISLLLSGVYVHTGSTTHAVARLQPLRAFLMIYIVMTVLLGCFTASWWKAFSGTWSLERFTALQAAPTLCIGLLALIMYGVQRAMFPASQHLEMPGRFEHSPNSWVQSFLWARAHTWRDALFAVDAHYITQKGEDAQTFRAIAQRSLLPDYSKDGGEAAITPGLTASWQAAEQAQTGLNTLDDAERQARLQAFGVDWVILLSSTPTLRPCPYDNFTVKICRL